MERFRIQPDARLNVLLTEDRPHAAEHWTSQLPRLLEPQGVAAYVVRTVQEAMTVAGKLEIHAAIVDLGTPLGDLDATDRPRQIPGGPVSARAAAGAAGGASGGGTSGGGIWMLELFRRLPHQPPIVVVHSPARSRREGDWILSQSLKLGAFSVLNKPVSVEQLLAVFQKLVDRQYRGAWPGLRKGPPEHHHPDHERN